MSYLVITFESTHQAIKAEKTLEGFEIEIIPTPRQLSANCGISIRGEMKDFSLIKEALGDSFNQMNQSYEVINNDGELTFKKL